MVKEEKLERKRREEERNDECKRNGEEKERN